MSSPGSASGPGGGSGSQPPPPISGEGPVLNTDPTLRVIPGGGQPDSPLTLNPTVSDSGEFARPNLHPTNEFGRRLQALIEGDPKQSSRRSHRYHEIQARLAVLSPPNSQGESRLEIKDGSKTYQLIQQAKYSQITFSYRQVHQAKHPQITLSVSDSNNPLKRLEVIYFADGNVQKIQYKKTNGQIERVFRGEVIPDTKMGVVMERHDIQLQHLLSSQVQQLWNSHRRFVLLRNALGKLAGFSGFRPGSTHYQNYVVLTAKGETRGIYSFEVINDNVRLDQGRINPEFHQIEIYKQVGNERYRLFTLSETGTINSRSTGPRQLPDQAQQRLLETFINELSLAHAEPKVYQAELERNLRLVEGGEALEAPKIQPALQAPQDFYNAKGSQGEEAIRIGMEGEGKNKGKIANRRLWQLIRPFSPSLSQHNAETGKMQRASVPWDMRVPLMKEFFLWGVHSVTEKGFGLLFDPPAKPNHYVTLNLWPDPTLNTWSGQMIIYRDNQPHDIVVVHGDGRVTKVGTIIRQMKRQDKSFKDLPRADQVRRAAQKIHLSEADPLPHTLIAVDPIDLSRIHLDKSSEYKVRQVNNLAEAYQLILEIPQLQGLTPRVFPEFEGETPNLNKPVEASKTAVKNVVESFLMGSGKVKRITLVYPGTSPAVSVLLQERMEANKPVIEILVDRGGDLSTVVFKGGRRHSGVNPYSLRESLHQAMRGRNLPTSPMQRTLYAIQKIPRFQGVGKMFHGIQYASGHFASSYLVQGAEYFYYTPEQRALIGTPSPPTNFGGFAKMTATYWAGLGAAHIASNLVDAFYLGGPTLLGIGKDWLQGRGPFMELYRANRPGYFSPDPTIRPVGRQWTRGFLQRSFPLLASLSVFEFATHGNIQLKRLGQAAGFVAGASTISNSALYLIQRSSRLSNIAYGIKAFKNAAGTVHGARHALTPWGSFLVICSEFSLMFLADSVLRKAELKGQEPFYRTQLAQALNQYNEYIARLENGEPIAPTKLLAAEGAVMETEKRYSDYLKMMGKEKGTMHWTDLNMENNFSRIYENGKTNQAWAKFSQKPNFSWIQASQLRDLRDQEQRLQTRLKAAYGQHGVPFSQYENSQEEARQALKELAQSLRQLINDSRETPQPSSIAKESAPKEATPSFDPESMDPNKLESLAQAIAKIYEEEQGTNPYIHTNAAALATNTADLEYQMQDYYRKTQERMLRAVMGFLPQEPLALHSPTAIPQHRLH